MPNAGGQNGLKKARKLTEKSARRLRDVFAQALKAIETARYKNGQQRHITA